MSADGRMGTEDRVSTEGRAGAEGRVGAQGRGRAGGRAHRAATAARGARGFALAILAVLLVVGLPSSRTAPDGALDLPRPLRVHASSIADDHWRGLRAHAAEASVHAVVSGDPPPFLLDPPDRLRAGRAGTLGVRAFAPVSLALGDPSGTEERLTLAAGQEEAFLLRPRQPGWAAWTIRVLEGGETPGADDVSWTGWAEPARPLRVLAISGPPTQESRFALRALEEAGEEVEAWISLGRDLWIGRDPGPLPADAGAYERFDLIALFPGVELAEGAARALDEAVRSAGRGLLLADANGGSDLFAAWSLRASGIEGWDGRASLEADSLTWTLPVEVAPLPPAGFAVEVRMAEGSEPNPLGLAAIGRGRVASLGTSDTWRWRMEADHEREHRAFWTTLAAWLAGGLAEDPALEILAADPVAGDRVRVRWVAREEGIATASDPPSVRVERAEVASVRVGRTEAASAVDPSASEEASGSDASPPDSIAFPLPHLAPAGWTATGSFAPLAPGGHLLAAGDTERGFHVATATAPTHDPAGRLARLALASPGGSVRVDPGGPPDDRFRGTAADAPGADPTDWWGVGRLALFLFVAALLGGAWALRRWAGLP